MGICLIAGIGIYFYLEKIHPYLSIYWRISMIAICLIFALLLTNAMLRTFHLVENYATGEVVFGISRIPNYSGHEYILLDVPEDLYLPANGGTLFKAISFYCHNPIFSLKLSILKGLYFLSHFKPYNSLLHNLHTLLLILPCYLGLFFLMKESKEKGIKSFVLGTIFCSTCIIMLTSEDWDGRFFMGIAPILFCFAFANKTLLPSFFRDEKMD